MKFPITPPIKDHGSKEGIVFIDLTKNILHKITLTGKTILILKDTINGTQKETEIEIEVQKK